jgi:hypothetical protein
VLSGAGIEVVKIPPRSPRANAYAGRWVPTVRAQVTDRMLLIGPRHLRAILGKYLAHDNQRRPHRAPNLRPPSTVEGAHDGEDTTPQRPRRADQRVPADSLKDHRQPQDAAAHRL